MGTFPLLQFSPRDTDPVLLSSFFFSYPTQLHGDLPCTSRFSATSDIFWWAPCPSISLSWLKPLQFFPRGDKGKRNDCWVRLTIVIAQGKVGIDCISILTISFLDYTGLTPSGLFCLQSIFQGNPDYFPLLNPTFFLLQTKPLMATRGPESKAQTSKLIIQYF